MKLTVRKCLIAAVAALTIGSARADEGMWLLQLMKQQNSIDMMKKQGLKLEADALYNPNGVSLKDAVGIFGGGCTGEIISPEGLILTNHHCGYDAIQQHSSVEHDYLTDGFWAMNRNEELPTSVRDLLKLLPNVTVTEHGQILVQGKPVSKILVDGKDFFSNNPEMASKSLPGKIVDKVQVIDQSSEVDRLTGFDNAHLHITIKI